MQGREDARFYIIKQTMCATPQPPGTTVQAVHMGIGGGHKHSLSQLVSPTFLCVMLSMSYHCPMA